MDEVLKKAMVDLVEWIKQSAEFVATQAPLVAQEYLRYRALIGWIWLVLALGVFIGSLYVLRAWWRLAKIAQTDRNDLAEKRLALYCLAWPVALVSCITSLVVANGLVMLYTAPRLYVLRALTELIGGR